MDGLDPKIRKRRLIMILIPAGVALICFIFIVSGAILVVPDALVAMRAPWTEPVPADWTGDGSVVGHFEAGDPMERHQGWRQAAALHSEVLGSKRCVLVYLPPDYDKEREEAYPVLYALHGFGRRPDDWVESLLPLLEEEIAAGIMPPPVVVMPDFSLSGNGSAEGPGGADGRGGSWYVDSNIGAYGTFFAEELRDWAALTYNIRTDAAGTALLGTSMGGFGALYHGLSDDGFASIVAAVYPAADLRYSVSGRRLADYDPDRYARIDRDRPRRAMMALRGSRRFGVSEAFFLYPVFGTEGSVWPESIPVWKRIRSVNPMDILETGDPDLTGMSFYLTAGDEDEFHFDDHLDLIEPALKRQGAEVAMVITPGLAHGWWWSADESYRRQVLEWLGAELRSRRTEIESPDPGKKVDGIPGL